MSSKIRVGSLVMFQNLKCKVIGKDGKDWILQPLGSRTESFIAKANQVLVCMNEGHLDTIRIEEYRNNMLND